MKTVRRFWWLAAIVANVVALGALLALPAWAAPARQSTQPPSDTISAMHAACAAGDVQQMHDAMEALPEEDWEAMGQHMGNGHHGAAGPHMAGHGGMMGAPAGAETGGWQGTMAERPGRGMLGGMMGGLWGRAAMGR
ncbi:MAG: hypothetical protein HY535_07275 [Chloroflexi bacterium]|nr:hypothetical protein [Chloroflexota bacterium]